MTTTDTDWITVLYVNRDGEDEHISLHANREGAEDELVEEFGVNIRGKSNTQIDRMLQDCCMWVTIRELPAP